MNFDLHTHTNFSACASRENTWQNLLKKAQENKIDVLSVTDHNSCVFHVVNKFYNTKEFFSGNIITGMECDVVENGVAFELLAYNFDVIKIFNWAYKTYGTLETRQIEMKNRIVKKIKEIGLKYDEVKPYDANTQYAHNYIFENLIKHKENVEFFKRYNIETSSNFYRTSTGDINFPLHVNLDDLWPNVKQVKKAIKKAGGFVVLAHPYNYNEKVDVEELLKIALKNKLDGVEVYHPSCDKKKIDYLLNFAKKHNLVITGGSDYHGNERHSEIGIKKLIKNRPIPTFLEK